MGPVRAWRDEEEIELGPRQQRAVLAALLLNNGIRLSNDQLIGMVWDDPTPSAVMALRTYVYKIRKTLPELNLKSQDGGYTVRAEIVDDCRGEPLEGLRSAYFDAQRLRLGDYRLKAREDCLERELDVLELQKHVAAFPLRERPRALLMRALYLEGRQGEALDHFHQVRALLVEELGLEPGPELHKVHAQILNGDLTLPRRPEQLVPDLIDFTGRAEEIAQALRTLPGTVGITGMRGSGKTALATRIGHLVKGRFPDGQIFVRGRDVANELLRAVGVENPVGDKAALWREKARGKRFLVVVDDVQDAATVRDLATPGSAMILTSVRRLHELPGVTWLKIAGLTEPEAREFLRKALGPVRADAEPEQAEVLLERLSRLPHPIRVIGGKLSSRPHWTIEMVLLQMERDSRLTDVIPSDCAAMMAPLIAAEKQLSDPERRMLMCFARQDAEVIDSHQAAEMSGVDAGEIELVLESLAGVHLIEPLVLGRYRLPRFVRLCFGLRAAASSRPDQAVYAEIML
ncbi:BTAD domain-containing putative transcriptional regulator [Streptomyces purpurascens]|uniref:BTAD domain-containing putative transcriptional regulator n=1 Tax=Streptomyces purpurascens TaxID=1924 RepID=UPI0016730779|nr:BTAD domain-containing putative transcriptional regulator [Streptomyces purpurascens]MCE7051383.1 winged helix-turn-helix domain-containing protein [Streptomyces purpurascens]